MMPQTWFGCRIHPDPFDEMPFAFRIVDRFELKIGHTLHMMSPVLMAASSTNIR
jgi:hypothetical protein